MLLVTCIYSFGNTVPSYWIKIWTEDQSHFALYAIGYGIIAFLAWASTSVNMWQVSPVSLPHFITNYAAGRLPLSWVQMLVEFCTKNFLPALLGKLVAEKAEVYTN